MEPGEGLLGLDLANGGHLTHGMRLNFSGKFYETGFYGVSDSGRIEMESVRAMARNFRPKVIVAGWSAYPRVLDFAAFRSIADEVGAHLWVDMAHFAGLVAWQAGVCEKRQLVGLSWDPGRASDAGRRRQGRHFQDRRDPAEFADRQRRTLSGARIIADRLLATDVANAGVSVVSGGTDVHLVLVDLRNSALDGKTAEDLLHEIGITVNRNAVPNDPRPPMVTSGLRIGTPALATRGFGDAEFADVADVIATALTRGPAADIPALRDRITRLARAFPLYEGLEDWELHGRK